MVARTYETGRQIADRLVEDFTQRDQEQSLADFVIDAARVAVRYKISIGVQRDMERARRAIDLEYDPEDIELLDNQTSDIYMGLTNLKVRAFRSWISDILLNSEDKPWTIRPSPVPDVPVEIEELIIDSFIEEVQKVGVTGTVRARLSEMKAIARSHIEKITSAAATSLETVIHDQLTEGGWRRAFDEFIDDLGTMPGAIIKGPYVEYKPRLKWSGGRATTVMTPVYVIKRVSPFDIFPSPDSQCPQSGSYLIERSRMSARGLRDCGKIKGFSEEAIDAVIQDSPQGWRWNEGISVEAEDEDNNTSRSGGGGGFSGSYGGSGNGGGGGSFGSSSVNGGGGSGTGQAVPDAPGQFDVLIYNGFINGASLHDWGYNTLDVLETYDTEVWVVGRHVIRAVLNPRPLGVRPYYVACFDKVPGSFWGRGLPCLLRDIQRVANATARSLVKNMAFSAGPIGEYDASRLSHEEDVTEVSPYRMYSVDADAVMPSQVAAFRFHNIPSSAQSLMDIYERFMRQADDVSGVPAYVLGNPDVAGAGRTLGGLSLLMGNAAKGIKKVISQVDKDVIEPMIEAYVAFNLLYSPNQDIKFDTFVVARGATGLLQRELSQSRAIELLQVLFNAQQAGAAPVEGLQIVLRDVIRGLGYRADEIIPDPQRGGNVEDFLARTNALTGAAQVPGQAFGQSSGQPPVSSQPATPLPVLDGRSQ